MSFFKTRPRYIRENPICGTRPANTGKSGIEKALAKYRETGICDHLKDGRKFPNTWVISSERSTPVQQPFNARRHRAGIGLHASRILIGTGWVSAAWPEGPSKGLARGFEGYRKGSRTVRRAGLQRVTGVRGAVAASVTVAVAKPREHSRMVASLQGQALLVPGDSAGRHRDIAGTGL